MKKVLIPTDFSHNAWDALTYAIRLYDDIPCRFYILNTFQASPSRMRSTMHKLRDTRLHRVLKSESEKELKKIIDHVNEHLLNNKHEYISVSRSSSLLTAIDRMVIKENIDIIIMGTTGATGAKEIFMGSNTVKVIKHVGLCPIISVPKKYSYQEPEQVIFAADFKKYISAVELYCLIELQLIHNFKIRLVYVKERFALLQEQLQNIELIKGHFNQNNITFEEVLLNTTVARAINDYADEQKVNMICLVNYEHSFIEKLTHEPIIKKVSFHSTVPLLIIPI